MLFLPQRASNANHNVGQESMPFGSKRASASNYNKPHHCHHQVFAFSDAQKLNVPQSVECRMDRLPDGQAAELQVRSNRYGQALFSNDRASASQVGHASYSSQASQTTYIAFPPQVAPNEYHKGGQVLTSGSNKGPTSNGCIPHHQHQLAHSFQWPELSFQ